MPQAMSITAGLSNVNVETGRLPGAGAKGSGVKFEPLLQSSTEAAPIPVQKFRACCSIRRRCWTASSRRASITRSPRVSAATSRPPSRRVRPAGVTLPAGQTALKQSAKPLHLVVFADTDMLSDFLWVH